MKVLKNITKIAFSSFLMLLLVSGCQQSADLSIDALKVNVPFTFTPSHGFPGNQVVIRGKNLSTVTELSFGVKAGVIVSKTDSTITATVPAGALSGKIKLVSDGLVITSATDFVVDSSPIPTVISFTPAIASSRDTITVVGNLLDQVDSIFVGTLKTNLIAKTATQIKFIAPVGLQTAAINMFYNYTTAYGMVKVAKSVSDKQLSLKLPTIVSFSKDITTLNVGDILTVKGTMFSKVTSVKFGNLVATYTAASDTAMTVTVPATATTGLITMTVPDGIYTCPSPYVVTLPAITSFFPFKGAEIVSPGTRDITLTGTKLDLVTSVTVGTTVATIMAQTANNLTINIPGTTTGIISLVSANGTVKSTAPFIITGTFWITDFDNTYTPSRFSSIGFNTVDNATSTIVNSGDPVRKNYANLKGTTKAAAGDNRARVYIQCPDGGGYTTPDGFSLYTSDSKGVYFSVDVNIKQIPAELLSADGKTVSFQIYAFSSRVGSAAPNPPYGFSKVITLPYVANDVAWKTVSVQLSDLIEDTNLADGITPTTATANRVRPDRLRIMSILFCNAPTTASPIEMNVDNAKFTIQ